ncbi:glutathione S-transferase family protein [Rhizobium tumorigenes]|uniref:glutathione S-transferase family protein n=1 Tax=Rhizobium tumorigenes TaxID=2041385 RepID=UPI00241BEEBE|nr:glutathione S-transferase family protein [Rhizobium tumorigenes]WFS03629.1 glutathione S-transferase family protein [Rhizobium tumorigenes]
MIDVYAFATPNSIKVPIALEELGLAYQLKPVNVRKGEQKQADFLDLNPNGKVPVLVDPGGPDGAPLTLTESAAILVYLAEKTGKLLPTGGVARARVFEQLFFHASGLGPAFGQAGFFKHNDEKMPTAIARFDTEANRTLAVLDGVLARSEFSAGEDFTISDIAHFGWLWRREFAGIDLSNAPHVARWYDTVSKRPAVQRAIERTSALVPQN